MSTKGTQEGEGSRLAKEIITFLLLSIISACVLAAIFVAQAPDEVASLGIIAGFCGIVAVFTHRD